MMIIISKIEKYFNGVYAHNQNNIQLNDMSRFINVGYSKKDIYPGRSRYVLIFFNMILLDGTA